MTYVAEKCCVSMHNFACSALFYWCLQSFLRHLADKAGLHLAQYIGTGTLCCIATACSEKAICYAFAAIAVAPQTCCINKPVMMSCWTQSTTSDAARALLASAAVCLAIINA